MLVKILIVLILLAIAAVCVGIILVKKAYKFSIKPKVTSINLKDIPSADAGGYAEYNRMLIKEGFKFLGDYAVTSDLGNTTYVRCYRDKNEGIEAHLFQAQVSNSRIMAIAFETKFDDGLDIINTTYAEPTLFKSKKQIVYQNSGMQWYELLRRHRTEILEAQKYRDFDWDWMRKSVFDNLIYSKYTELKEQEKYGVLKYHRKTETYYYTFKGAAYGLIILLKLKYLNKMATDDKNKNRELQIKKKKERFNIARISGFVLATIALIRILSEDVVSLSVLYNRLLLILLGLLIALISTMELSGKKVQRSWQQQISS